MPASIAKTRAAERSGGLSRASRSCAARRKKSLNSRQSAAFDFAIGRSKSRSRRSQGKHAPKRAAQVGPLQNSLAIPLLSSMKSSTWRRAILLTRHRCVDIADFVQ